MDVYSIVSTVTGARMGLFISDSEAEALADLARQDRQVEPAANYEVRCISSGEASRDQLVKWLGETETRKCDDKAPDLTGKGQHPDIDVWTATHTIRVGDTRIHVTIAYEFDIETLPVSEDGALASDGRRHAYPEDSSDLNWDGARTGYVIQID